MSGSRLCVMGVCMGYYVNVCGGMCECVRMCENVQGGIAWKCVRVGMWVWEYV